MKHKTCSFLLFTLLWLGAAGYLYGQFNPDKVARIDDGKLVITLDKRWTPAQRKVIAERFALDSLLFVQAFQARPEIRDSGEVWKTHKLDVNRIELIQVQEAGISSRSAAEPVFLLDDDLVKIQAESERESEPYGVNRMTRNTVVMSGANQCRFFLPGYTSARKVYLAGSFNGWSTLQTPMQRSDSGWLSTMPLEPGKYSYKYIVDGKWISDPFNRKTESDLHGGVNSVFFVYNYQFTLKGFPAARNVVLAGSFNNWNQRELRMIRFKDRWVVRLYLREGTHAYKFLVDGEWMNDPANKITRPDGRGNINSFMSIGDTFYFSLRRFPGASKVAIAGNFNAWNPGELYMDKISGGWELPYVLRAGNYEYKYIVDGKWMPDPENPFTTGSGDYTNSFLVVKPNFSFRLEGYPQAGEVIVTGTFNGWNRSGYRMVKRKNVWLFPIFLNPGKHLYKFIVDGKYILDPGNELWEENEYGTGNSVLWINP